MITVIEEAIVILAHPDDPDGPAIHIHAGEVLFDTDGVFLGWDHGDRWEALEFVPGVDDIDATLAAHGYRRTTAWSGPVVTRRGQRWTAGGVGHIEPV
ncbi:hypothetical protein [Nocardia nova]|uniref:hypothetical protein n=1 Tax=Nocardia nova TaxID=37330 RepID=UPI0007A3F2A6|nr:hypothetical protein [Nocardia nova]